MDSDAEIRYREATLADVVGMAQCRLTDPDAGAADPRMAAYFTGEHHPQQALLPRVGFVAESSEGIIGYIAGHRARRFDCDGEVQYLYVAPRYRRRGIASGLMRALAGWFRKQGVAKVCVDVNADSPAAEPFYVRHGAIAIDRHWYMWEDMGAILDDQMPPPV